jgi:hypothetical protein
MRSPTTCARANWAIDRATSLSEMWAIVAEHLGLVGAWQLMLVCRAACAGAKEYLATLPGLVVCGNETGGSGPMSDVRRLNLATLRWETMPSLLLKREDHACCAVRGALVVLGGKTSGGRREATSSVEMLSKGKEAFTALPPLSCGKTMLAAAVTVEESGSVAGQVLLLGRCTDGQVMSTVHLVDLATGVCTPQPNLLVARYMFAAARLPDGCVVCAGGYDGNNAIFSSAEILLEPPAQGATDAAWTQRELPALSVERFGCRGCVLSDGRFAVLGGMKFSGEALSSCEVLAVGHGEHWEHLPPMHDARTSFACAAVAGCVIVVGGCGLKSAEVFDEVLDRWLRLPCDLPIDGQLYAIGSTLL